MRKREGNKEQAILEASVKVFAQYGYHHARIASIAEQAGIATGSIYLYYKDKEAILLTIFDRLWTELTDGLRKTLQRSDIDPLQKLDLVIDTLFDLFTANPALASVFVNEQHHLIKNKRGNVAKQYDDFLDLAEEIIREGVHKNKFNPDVDIKLFRHFITGGLRSVLRQWAEKPQTLTLNRLRQNVKNFIKHGLL
jgi:TetR/AcrR family transcriptional regulator, fatty acid metabolism regulator protein